MITAAWIARHDPKTGGAPPSTQDGWVGPGALVGGVVLVSGWLMAGFAGRDARGSHYATILS